MLFLLHNALHRLNYNKWKTIRIFIQFLLGCFLLCISLNITFSIQYALSQFAPEESSLYFVERIMRDENTPDDSADNATFLFDIADLREIDNSSLDGYIYPFYFVYQYYDETTNSIFDHLQIMLASDNYYANILHSAPVPVANNAATKTMQVLFESQEHVLLQEDFSAGQRLTSTLLNSFEKGLFTTKECTPPDYFCIEQFLKHDVEAWIIMPLSIIDKMSDLPENTLSYLCFEALEHEEAGKIGSTILQVLTQNHPGISCDISTFLIKYRTNAAGIIALSAISLFISVVVLTMVLLGFMGTILLQLKQNRVAMGIARCLGASTAQLCVEWAIECFLPPLFAAIIAVLISLPMVGFLSFQEVQIQSFVHTHVMVLGLALLTSSICSLVSGIYLHHMQPMSIIRAKE